MKPKGTHGEERPPERWRLIGVVGMALAVLAAAPYVQTIAHGFCVLDDDDYVATNLIVQSGLNRASIAWAFTATAVANWHPLTWLSHMADCALFGLRPGFHHLVSVLLHAANAVLVLLVLWRMTRQLWPSALVAALFALHPLHVESVAWLAERKDVLSTFFGLGAMLAYATYCARPSVRRYAAVPLLFTLSLLAKPMWVTLPFALLLLDWWPLGRLHPEGWRRSWRLIAEKVPLFILTAISCVITYRVQQGGGAVRTLDTMPLWARLANGAVAYAQYAIKTIWPAELAIFYPHPGLDLPWPQVALAVAGLALITAASIRVASRRPYITVGWLWYLGTLVPVIGLVQVGSQAIADRYTYLPLLGLFIGAVWGGAALVQAWPRLRMPATAMAAAILAVLTLLTVFQVRHWRDNVALFEHALAVTPSNDVAHANLGIALHRQGREDEAEQHFRDAVKLRPNYVMAHVYLGIILAAKGNTEEALEHYRLAAGGPPSDPAYADAINNIGTLLMARGQYEEAVVDLRKSAQLQPCDPDPQYNLGLALLELKKTDEAAACFRKALSLDPNHHHAKAALEGLSKSPVAQAARVDVELPTTAKACFEKGNAYAQEKKYAAAARLFAEAVRLEPAMLEARLNLGNSLALQGSLQEAAEQYRLILAEQPNNIDALINLGNICFETGKMPQAAQCFRKVTDLQPRHVQAHVSLGYTLASLGKSREAVQTLSRALTLDPKCTAARQALDQLQGAQ